MMECNFQYTCYPLILKNVSLFNITSGSILTVSLKRTKFFTPVYHNTAKHNTNYGVATGVTAAGVVDMPVPFPAPRPFLLPVPSCGRT